jgi:hypothetical protein
MDAIRVDGFVDDNHHLSANVPGSVPPGPVTIWISAITSEDEAGHAWSDGIGNEWAEDLADRRQDIYTIADGEPVDTTW